MIFTINYSMGINSGDEENLTNRLANGLTALKTIQTHIWWTSLLKDSTA